MNLEKSKRNKTIDFSLDGGGQIYLDKCIKGVTALKALPDFLDKTILGNIFEVAEALPNSFVDLCIVDPPYNLSKDYNGMKFSKMGDDNYEVFTKKWIEAIKHVLKPTASMYVCCDWKSSLIIGPILQNYFTIQNRITWQREKGRGSKANWKNGLEDIWFVTNSKTDYTFNLDAVKIRRKVIASYKVDGVPKDWEDTEDGKFRNTCPSNFWDDVTVPYWSMPENTEHPTQKPEKLIAKLILASSNKGDVVFDPFLGSGTTSVTAAKLDRRYLGCEQNPLYCSWGQFRLEKAITDKTIQGYTDGIFYERNSGSIKR